MDFAGTGFDIVIYDCRKQPSGPSKSFGTLFSLQAEGTHVLCEAIRSD